MVLSRRVRREKVTAWPVTLFVLSFLACCNEGPAGAYKVEPISGDQENLVVEAAAAEGGKAVPVKWLYVYEARKKGKKGKRKQVAYASGESGSASFKLKPGRYVLRADAGPASKEMEVSVQEGKRSYYRLVLGAGWVKVRVVAAEGGKQVPVKWIRAMRESNDEAGERRLVKVDEAFSTGGEHRFFLPAGQYQIRVEQGPVSAAENVKVEAGKLSEKAIVLDAGWLKVRVVAAEGGKQVPIKWIRVFRQDTDEAGEKKLSKVDEVFNTSGEYRFFLPAGEYVVRAEQGPVSARAKVAVKAGKLSKETIVLGAGWIKVRVVDSSKGKPVQVKYIRVWKKATDAAGEKKLEKVAEAYRSGGGATFFLPAGDYEVSAEQEKEIGRESAVVEAGKAAELELRVVSR